MASSAQQVQVNGQLSDKEKAALEEAVQEAQNFLAANNGDNAMVGQHQLVRVGGVMKNLQHRLLTLQKVHYGEGRFVSGPPERIDGEDSAKFLHQGTYSQGHLPVVVGSKGAIIYGTIDRMFPALGYLLAWDKPDSNQYNKVYVEAGDSYKLQNMGWSEIEQKLADSSDESLFRDPHTGAAAAAKMKAMGNKLAVISATFDRVLIGIPQPKP